MRRVRVGDVLELQRRQVEIHPEAEYREIGVRSFGKGIFHKEPVTGIELGSKRVFEIHPGDLVFSNVFAWEGAVGLASVHDAGRIGSHRFMTYTTRDAEQADVSYLRFFFTSERGIELLGIASPGSAGRNRTLAVERLEAIELPLPAIEEQRRIAAHLDRTRSIAGGLQQRTTSAPAFYEALVEAAVQRIFDEGVKGGWDVVPLGEVADINPRRSKVDPEEVVAFVPMSGLDDVTGRIVRPEQRLAAEVGSGYKQFLRGDVVFARITPCMQNGKSAVVTADLPAVGFGSTEFHVIRPGERALAGWIHAVVRSRDFKLAAADRFTGTAGQQRVPAAFLEDVAIPLPGTTATQLKALEHIDWIRGRALELRRLVVKRDALAGAMIPSALNRAFAGLV